jgi:hypothetical protein
MEDSTIIESSYERVEQIELWKRKVKPVVIGSALLASSGLALNGAAFVIISHQKGDTSLYIASIAIVTILCIILALFVANKYILLKNLSNKLEQLELLEKTIYSEVLQPKMDQSK